MEKIAYNRIITLKIFGSRMPTKYEIANLLLCRFFNETQVRLYCNRNTVYYYLFEAKLYITL